MIHEVAQVCKRCQTCIRAGRTNTHRRDERLKVERRSTVALDRELLPDVEAILALSSSAVIGSRYLPQYDTVQHVHRGS